MDAGVGARVGAGLGSRAGSGAGAATLARTGVFGEWAGAKAIPVAVAAAGLGTGLEARAGIGNRQEDYKKWHRIRAKTVNFINL